MFYKKDTGDIFSIIDGRVHNENQLKCKINDGSSEENIGKYIIGWIENEEQTIECNIDKMDILKDFESTSPSSPLDYKIDIEKNILVKKSMIL